MPVLTAGGEWIWEAFQVLGDRRRTTEHGPDPISMVDLLAYATYQRIDGEFDRDMLLQIVSSLDNIFLVHVRKEMKRVQESRRRQGRGRK